MVMVQTLLCHSCPSIVWLQLHQFNCAWDLKVLLSKEAKLAIPSRQNTICYLQLQATCRCNHFWRKVILGSSLSLSLCPVSLCPLFRLLEPTVGGDGPLSLGADNLRPVYKAAVTGGLGLHLDLRKSGSIRDPSESALASALYQRRTRNWLRTGWASKHRNSTNIIVHSLESPCKWKAAEFSMRISCSSDFGAMPST